MVKIEQLLPQFDPSTVVETSKIQFHGVEGNDVYNITAPFENNGNKYIAGRVEKRDSELSKVVFFKHQSDCVYVADETLPTFDLQDPYFTFINGELVLGGTEVFPHPELEGELWYNAVKYRGADISSLERFFSGPYGMKDIRILELADGRILVFSRPQGEIGGRGQIGTAIIENLEQLNEIDLVAAPLLNTFIDEEWGGANEAHLLENGKVGVLSHIAKFDEEGNRHYYASTFELDIDTMEVSDFKIIITRSVLAKGESKRPDLEDVVFSGGIVLGDEFAEVYVGAGDCEAHYAKIRNPFMRG